MSDVMNLLKPRTASVEKEAGFFRRAFAFFVDVAIIDLFVTSPFSKVFSSLLARAEQTGPFAITYTSRELGAVLALFIVVYAYFVAFEYVLAQTPGMMLLGNYVVSDDSLWKPLVRNLFLFPVFPFVLFWIVEPVGIALFKRGSLEFLTSTKTVHRKEVLF